MWEHVTPILCKWPTHSKVMVEAGNHQRASICRYRCQWKGNHGSRLNVKLERVEWLGKPCRGMIEAREE